MIRTLHIFVFLFFPLVLYSQTEDCVGAYPVCGNGDIEFTPDGVGIDDFASRNNNRPDCQFTESKSMWLRIIIKQGGTLGFEIIPEINTGPNREDYDFAVYGPDRPCDNLGSSIRCQSSNPIATGLPGNTGMRESETATSGGPGRDGNNFVKWLENVQKGEVYYILIDNFGVDVGNQNGVGGFTLEWTGDALLEDRITKENGGVDLGPDQVLCEEESLLLDATTLGGVDYRWNTGENTEQIEITQAGEYQVQVTTISGCFSRDTIIVTEAPPPTIDFVEATPNDVCEPAAITLSADGTGTSFEWFDPQGNSIGSEKTITLDSVLSVESGSYSVKVTNENGCAVSEQVPVRINRNYLIENQTTLCPGDVFEVPFTGEEVRQTDTVTVTFPTVAGCDSTFLYDVQFLSCGDRQCTGLPNSFSPNQNNANEQFKPIFKARCTPIQFELSVYNRWGEAIFTTNNPAIGWDGTTNSGNQAQNGFYLWQMAYAFPDEPDEVFQLSGGVTLIR